ncbi:MAG: hypothetical protein GF398_05360 [Chitinivibrionales bacterium]|nr:hypothetical protein [Chitinivibrionales bacterium]
MQNQPEQAVGLSLKQARMLARSFNVVINSANFYGSNHPTTQNFIKDFGLHLSRTLEAHPSLTIIKQGESLYLEQHCIDNMLKVSRILQLFARAGIESITFDRGIRTDEIGAIVDIFYDSGESSDIHQALVEKGVLHIRINYMLFKKVTTDDTIVQGPVPEDFTAKKDQSLEQHALDKLDKVISLKEMVARPHQLAGDLVASALSDDQERRRNALAQLWALNQQLSTPQSAKRADASINELIEAVCAVKVEMREGLKLQKEIGRLVRHEDALHNEIDQVACSVIIRLVCEEYERGDISVKRLARVIQRLIPDVAEIKKLIPRLKDALLNCGMGLADFLELIKELTAEFADESLLGMLRAEAEKFGMSVEEIHQAIQKNPNESARLILLAAEIKTLGGVQPQLAEILTDYVEKISSSMTAQEFAAQHNPAKDTIESTVQRIEKELLEKVKRANLAPEMVAHIENELSGRFDGALQKLKSNWIVNLVNSGAERPESYLMQLVDTIIDQDIELESIREPLHSALKDKGLDEEQIGAFYKDVAGKVEKKQFVRPLPKGVLQTNNILYFLQRQLKRCLRYENPFSTLMVSVLAHNSGGVWTPATHKLNALVLPDIFAILKKQLRDLDLIGSLGTIERDIPFVVLPETRAHGAASVKNRVESALKEAAFTVRNDPVSLLVAVSITVAEKTEVQEVMQLLEVVKANHSAEVQSIRKRSQPVDAIID